MRKGIASLVLTISIFLILVVPPVSANIGEYDEATKTMTIYNDSLDLIANITLLSPYNVNVFPGEEKKVAEFHLESFPETYAEPLRTIEFYDNKRGGRMIDRGFAYKTRHLIGEKNLSQWVWIGNCINESLELSPPGECERMEINTTLPVYEYRRIKFNNLTNLPGGNYTIGVFAEVNHNDYVEWIPTFYDIRITQWATWTESLSLGLSSYYKLNGTAGAVIDSIGNYNGVNLNGTTRGVAGKINNSFRFETASENIVTINGSQVSENINFTISMWINANSSTDASRKFYSEGNTLSSNPAFRFFHDNTDGEEVRLSITDNAGTTQHFYLDGVVFNGSWHHIVYTEYNNTWTWYVNGIQTDNGTHNNAVMSNLNINTIGAFGRTAYTDPWTGNLDEIGLWNRTLSQAEVTQLYNNGTGITYTTAAVANITIAEPTNSSYVTRLINLSVTNGTSIDSWWFSIDSGTTNYSFTPNTTFWSGVGSNTLNVWGNSSGTVHTDSVMFNATADTLSLILSSPENTTYTTVNVSLDGIPINLDIYWYSINGGTNNTTFTLGSNVTFSEGHVTLNVWGNDSGNAIAGDEVEFTVNLSTISMSIVYPENKTYYNNVSELNYTIAGTGDRCWYSNGSTNFSDVAAGTNFTNVVPASGHNNWTVYCNDSSDNENSTLMEWTWDYSPFLVTNISTGVNFVRANDTSINVSTTGQYGIREVYVYKDSNLLDWGVTHYYTLNGTTGAVIDATGGNDGIIINSTIRGVAGKINNSFYFNRTENNSVVNLNGSQVSNNSNFTIAMWIKAPATAADRKFYSEGYNLNNSPAIRFYQDTTNQSETKVTITDNNGSSTTKSLSGTVFDNTWHYIVFVKRDNTWTWYRDGVNSANGNLISLNLSKINRVTVGAFGRVNYYSDWWIGNIDELGLWNRALTQTDVSQLYNNGTGRTFSARSYIGSFFMNFSNNIDGDNISMTGAIINTNYTGTKSLISNTSGIARILNRSLLIPRVTDVGAVYICPNASTSGGINASCPGKVTLAVDETEAGMTMSEVTIDGRPYYKIINITGTGGGEGSAPTLTNGNVTPRVGALSDTYYYNVTYTDAENDTASGVILIVNGTSNYTMTEFNSSDLNVTDGKVYNVTLSLPGGLHNFSFWAADEANISINTTTYIGPEVDIVSPKLIVNSPQNISYNVSSMVFNITANETLGYCNFNLSNSNYTMTNTSLTEFNYTNSSIPDAQYTATFWCNDSVNNVNTTSVMFIIDTAFPQINYSTGNPVNYANSSSTSIFINTSWDELNPDSILFRLHNDTAEVNVTTYTSPSGNSTNITWTGLPEAVYTYNVTLNDTAGNSNTTLTRTITLNTTNPTLTIASPQNTSYNVSSILFNLSANKMLSYCRFTINNWATNYTMVIDGVYANYTNASMSDAQYLSQYWCNDTSNNPNIPANVTFIVDTVFPQINYTSPTPSYGTNQTFDSIFVNTTWTETNPDVLLFRLHNFTGEYNVTSRSVNYTNWTGLPDGIYYFNVTLNDTAGHSNTTDTRKVIVDTLAPNVSLVSPADYTNTSNLSINFTALMNDSGGLKNATLYVYNSSGLYNNTTVTFSADTTSRTTGIMVISLIDGVYTWFYTVFDWVDQSTTIQLTNYTFTIDNTTPVLNITYPSLQVDYHRNATNFTFNWSYIELNPDTCFLDYSGTNFSVNCSDNSSIYTPVNITDYSNKNITFWMNDSFGISTSFTRNWTYKVYENDNSTYDNDSYRGSSLMNFSYEGESETYILNMSTDGNATVNAYLVYNGTSYSATRTNTTLNDIIFSRTINVPMLGDATTSWFWNIIYGNLINESINTTYLHNESIIPINLVRCNSTVDTPYLFFNFREEVNTSHYPNATSDLVEWVYWLNDSTYNKSYNFINNTENQNYSYCFTPPNRTLYGNVDYDYAGTNYPLRKWHNYSWDIPVSYTHNQTLWMLPTADGQYVAFNVVDTSGSPVEDAQISITRSIAGSEVEVGFETTDATGSATFWLNPGEAHTINVTHPNCTELISTIAPSESSYTITLSCLGVVVIGGGSSIEGIRYSRSPYVGGITQAANETFFEYKVVSLLYNLTKAKFELYFSNGTFIASNESFIGTPYCNATQCYLTLKYNTTKGDDIKAKYYLAVNNTLTGDTGYVLLEGDARWRFITTSTSSFKTIKDVSTLLKDFFTTWHPAGDDSLTQWDDWSDLNCGQYITNVTCNAGGCAWEEAIDSCYDFNLTNRLEYSRIVFVFLSFSIILTIFGRLTGYDAQNPGSFLLLLTLIVGIGTFANGLTGPGFFYYGDLTSIAFINNTILFFTLILFSIGYWASLTRRFT